MNAYVRPTLSSHPLDPLITFTNHLYRTAENNGLPPGTVDILSALKDAAEQLYVTAERVSLGDPLNAPEVALCVSVALSKIREAHEVAGVQPVPVGEAAERLHAGADLREAQERSTD